MSALIADTRAFFAEEIRVVANIRAAGIVEAFARVPRERFLPPGPWLIRSAYDMEARRTDDDNPRHVYHDVVAAIDPARNLYNGQPTLIARWLEGLAIRPGERVLHIGCGTGYFTAIMADIVGPSGRVFAVDVDPDLARQAGHNLAGTPWAQVSAGDGRTALPKDIDVVLVHAGATHVLDEWLDAARDGARLLAPLTGVIPGMPAGIGKGMVLTAERRGADWLAKVGGMVAIYSLVGLRDASREAGLGQSMMSGKLSSVTRLRRDAHEPDATCVAHGPVCLST
jgi:protein-L-isoaspartate(D-aspartate) O-methyltransferase